MKDFFGKIVSFFKNEKNSIIKPTVVLLAICIIIPLALAVTNKITAPKIAALEEQSAKEALKELISDADNFIEKEIDGLKFNVAQKKGEDVAYIFTTSANGYGGKDSVTVMTAISISGEILNLKVLDVSNETPGLGQKATDNDWNIIGKSGEITIEEINTITSATITSKAVLSAVNEALENYRKLAAVPSIEPDVFPEDPAFAIPEDPSATTEEMEVVNDEKQ